MARIRFGIALPPQHVSWTDYQAVVTTADGLNFDSFWTWDHLLPISGDLNGSEHESYTTLAALAAVTHRIRLGALVSGVAYRNPSVQIKMATEIDVISGGRFDWGIGAGWAEREFKAFNIPFATPKERIGELRETLKLATMVWSGDPTKKVTYEGKYVQAHDLFINPQPVQQPHPPILIGGGGEQLTLRVVAQYADIWHGFGDLATLKHKSEIIAQYAKEYGRNGDDIVKSTTVQVWVGDPPESTVQSIAKRLGRPADQVRDTMISGRPEEIETRLRTYVDAGVTYLIVSAVGLDYAENWRRISEEIIPRFANG